LKEDLSLARAELSSMVEIMILLTTLSTAEKISEE
jgi:hypothetical protein